MRMNGLCESRNLNHDNAATLESSLSEATNFDLNFNIPDLRKLKIERHARNYSLLNNINKSLCENYPASYAEQLSLQDVAAIKIQKVFRGYLGRKYYLNILYEAVLTSEESLYKQQELQVRDGELIIENYKMERELEDRSDIDRNKSRLLNTNAITIQRLWREKRNSKHKDHICCPCHETYPDLYEYYNHTEVICFCCDDHRINGYNEGMLSFPNDEYIYDSFENISDEGNEGSILPSITDWSRIESVLFFENGNNNDDNMDNSNEDDILKLNSSNETDLQLTFVDSYEGKLTNPNVEIYDCDESVDFLSAIETVTDTHSIRSPDALEPVEESTRILKSLEIHEDFENKVKMSANSESKHDLENMSIERIKELVQKLESDISCKNMELLEELMMRDELHTCHQALLMEADDLTKGMKS